MNPISLNDKSVISWSKPAPKNVYTVVMYGEGSTILMGYKGIEEVKKELKNYIVHSSAAKYLAQIKRFEKNGSVKFQSNEGCSEPMKGSRIELLFKGSITIYSKGIIPGTELQGSDHVLIREINYATPNINNNLDEIISEENIESIILGYNLQDEEKNKTKKNIDFKRNPDDYEPHYRGQSCC